MTTMPGIARLASTARPADKGTTSPGRDHALIRRTVTALCALADAAGRPMRRSVARSYVRARAAEGSPHAAILKGARDELGLYVDETGATAVRNVDRERGGRR
ncbi:hypothetical protein [Microlunatus sp. Y2014]|uniref:hypothetical protein n=1 Tax=Microlunatus sp. Y2014 TaxID=3418488 RepID=UPI003DA756B5